MSGTKDSTSLSLLYHQKGRKLLNNICRCILPIPNVLNHWSERKHWAKSMSKIKTACKLSRSCHLASCNNSARNSRKIIAQLLTIKTSVPRSGMNTISKTIQPPWLDFLGKSCTSVVYYMHSQQKNYSPGRMIRTYKTTRGAVSSALQMRRHPLLVSDHPSHRHIFHHSCVLLWLNVWSIEVELPVRCYHSEPWP